MTDSQLSGRIDLRAVDEPPDPAQADRVVLSALWHTANQDLVEVPGILTRLGTLLRPAMAVAAIFIFFATALLRRTALNSPSTPLASLSSWAEAGQVPTNGELLSAFMGYAK